MNENPNSDNPEVISADEIAELSENDIPAITVDPEPSVAVTAKPPQAAVDSAITVFTPYQPQGPSATQLEKAAAEAKSALRKQQKADRRRLRTWKKDARRKAAHLLGELRACADSDERASVKMRYRHEKKAWSRSLRDLDRSEKVLQKKAFKAFRRRMKRTRRVVSWIIVLALAAGIVYAAVPVWENAGTVLSMKYSTSGEAADAARAESLAVSSQIADEGIVLLRNENGLLPLENGKLNVFGADSYKIRSGSGSGTEISLFDGLEAAGIAYNRDLHSVYLDAGYGKSATGSGKECLTDEVIASAVKYSDCALMVIGNDSRDGDDCSPSTLALSTGRQALLKTVADNFSHVIVVINSANPMELGILNSFPSVEAVIWIGTPGPRGCGSLGRILAGEVNPSGRLTDTWAYSTESAPASSNFPADLKRYSYSSVKANYLKYEEGIYVGYRYYETRYAGDESGYSKAVMYPFGYGLSYTDFTWETLSFRTTADSAFWRVRVTNTGEMAGRDVLQLYCSAPYSEDGPEKSAIGLAAFAKTELIEPGASDVVTLSFRLRDMASYSVSEGAYILGAGTYGISLRRNVHDEVESEEYEVAEPMEYRTDETTGAEIGNRFEFADGDVTYLSRADWIGTYPKGLADEPKASSVKADAKAYSDPASSDAALPETNANNGIKLSDLRGLGYGDEKWEEFLDQFSMDELYALCSGAGWHTIEISRLGIPGTKMLDGPSGLTSCFRSIDSAAFPTEIVLGSTWDVTLARLFGEACANEAQAYGVQVWYAPSAGIHRSPFGGNNYSSYSEDPLLSGMMAAYTVRGAEKRNVIAVLRDFAPGGEKIASGSNVYIWADEQALRELYLRPFEIAVKEGGAHGVMTASSHIGYKWCGACTELLRDVLRDEWGFEGFVTTSAVDRLYMDPSLACRSGTDLLLEPGLLSCERRLRLAYSSDPSGITLALRNGAHNFCYTLVNSSYLF